MVLASLQLYHCFPLSLLGFSFFIKWRIVSPRFF
jgi:hypothetical protein